MAVVSTVLSVVAVRGFAVATTGCEAVAVLPSAVAVASASEVASCAGRAFELPQATAGKAQVRAMTCVFIYLLWVAPGGLQLLGHPCLGDDSRLQKELLDPGNPRTVIGLADASSSEDCRTTQLTSAWKSQEVLATAHQAAARVASCHDSQHSRGRSFELRRHGSCSRFAARSLQRALKEWVK